MKGQIYIGKKETVRPRRYTARALSADEIAETDNRRTRRAAKAEARKVKNATSRDGRR